MWIAITEASASQIDIGRLIAGPVSALDVSVQAQIVELLGTLKRELGLTYLFISHDIAVIGNVSDEVAVMYRGRIVERGPARAILRSPEHPFTRALMSAVPYLDGSRPAPVRLLGDLPLPLNPPSGCRFHDRGRSMLNQCGVRAGSCRAHARPNQG